MATVDEHEKAARQAEKIVASTAAKMFVRMGLRPIVGRTWAVLYLSPEPLHAETLRARLGISAGALSQVLRELLRFGLVYRQAAPDERRFFYSAEPDLWVVITQAFRAHVRDMVAEAAAAVKNAEELLRAGDDGSPASRMVLERVHHLVNVGEFMSSVLDAVMERTRVELKAAQKILSVSGMLGGEPLSALRRVINATRLDRKKREERR